MMMMYACMDSWSEAAGRQPIDQLGRVHLEHYNSSCWWHGCTTL